MAINWINDGDASESGQKMGWSDFRHYKTKSKEYRIHAHGNNKYHLTIFKLTYSGSAIISMQMLYERWDMSMVEVEDQINITEGENIKGPEITAEMIECAKGDGMVSVDDFKQYFIGWYANQKACGRSYYNYEYTDESMSHFFKGWIANEENKKLLV